jgi:hypothetical protein
MKIKFLRDCKYPQNDPSQSRDYKAGEVYDLPRDHALRWIRRQAAIEFVEEPKPKRAPEKLVPTKTESV